MSDTTVSQIHSPIEDALTAAGGLKQRLRGSLAAVALDYVTLTS